MRDVFGVREGFEGQLLSLPKGAKISGTSREWLHKEVVAGRAPQSCFAFSIEEAVK
jgi:hypothetical protein